MVLDVGWVRICGLLLATLSDFVVLVVDCFVAGIVARDTLF